MDLLRRREDDNAAQQAEVKEETWTSGQAGGVIGNWAGAPATRTTLSRKGNDFNNNAVF